MTNTPKIDDLRAYVRRFKKVAVALSGGMDSSSLLAFCAETFGPESCVAFVAKTPYMPAREQLRAHDVCEQLGVECVIIDAGIPDAIAENPPQRCYLCKTALFTRLLDALPDYGADALFDGTNRDDLGDHRPGMRALKELNVLSPFLECGWGKADIRELYKKYFPDRAEAVPKPNACLLTRLAHGMKVDTDLLEHIDQAEDFLRDKGFDCVRVRVGHEGARIEIEPQMLPDFLQPKLVEETSAYFKKLGFEKLSLDLNGYRRGAMNAAGAA